MRRILYLGLEVPDELTKEHEVTHLPLIQIVPRPKENPEIRQALDDLAHYTHVLFTSKTAVDLFFSYTNDFKSHAFFASVGSKTADRIRSYGFTPSLIAKEETAEGLIEALSSLNLTEAYLFWPHSALSRDILTAWMESHQLRYRATIFYDTLPLIPHNLPQLGDFEEIMFTSPSTVDAFLSAYNSLPKDKIINCIGPITRHHLQKRCYDK
jgi:uroporphyrinogen-III synthase